MPRGGHKVKPVKAVQVETSATPDAPSTYPSISKIRLPQSFLSRNTSAPKLPESIPEQISTPQDVSCGWTPKLDLPIQNTNLPTDLKVDQIQGGISNNLFIEQRIQVQTEIPYAIPEEGQEGQDARLPESDTFALGVDRVDSLSTESTTSLPIFSKSSASIYSRASSIHSSASSVYSSEASIYSFEDCNPDDFDPFSRKDSTDDVTVDSRLPNGLPYNPTGRPAAPRRLDSQDAAARQNSALAKKAALFKNSRLSPQLPLFSTSLPTWAMACRAAKASQDCYNMHAATRWGTYTPADPYKDIKAMIVDDQLIDGSRIVIVAIRGTQSLKDWNVNTAANPTKPVGFLDEEENACHAGFLQVSKAMVSRVAEQLRDHPALSQCPTLLFTGHSAGGAIAAILYSHMLSTTAQSELTELTHQFSSISCVTFGAPPVSLTPLLRREQVPGVFLAFANEGDPVLRTSNAAYFRSLAKLRTASAPPPTTVAAPAPPPVKVIRGSRGATVYRQAAPIAPPTPWEELPVWPTPAPSLSNAGDIILLRDGENGVGTASPITCDDLKDVMFANVGEHPIEMYIRRVKDSVVTTMFGREP